MSRRDRFPLKATGENKNTLNQMEVGAKGTRNPEFTATFSMALGVSVVALPVEWTGRT